MFARCAGRHTSLERLYGNLADPIDCMERKSALLCPAAIIALYVFVGLAVLLSPWFRWEANALSDLGNPSNGVAAAMFNGGIAISGLLLLKYSVSSLRKNARRTSYGLSLVAVFLMLVGALHEGYGPVHTLVSVLLFASMLGAGALHFYEKGSRLALAGMAGIFSWLLYLGGITGAAVPETISWMAATPWIALSAKSVYTRRTK